MIDPGSSRYYLVDIEQQDRDALAQIAAREQERALQAAQHTTGTPPPSGMPVPTEPVAVKTPVPSAEPRPKREPVLRLVPRTPVAPEPPIDDVLKAADNPGAMCRILDERLDWAPDRLPWYLVVVQKIAEVPSRRSVERRNWMLCAKKTFGKELTDVRQDVNEATERIEGTQHEEPERSAPPLALWSVPLSETPAPRVLTQPWPTLHEHALYGLAGEIVCALDPYTEADPAATLINTLVAFGSIIGSHAHFVVEQTKHSPRLFVALVGRSAKARKGTSWDAIKFLFTQLDPEWAKTITGGLSSGEGLIYNVRDARIEQQPIKKSGRVEGYQPVTVDHGVADKRLLLVEAELSAALKVMRREGNTLSAIIRQAWDTGDLRPLTKTNPIRATGAHIAILGQITQEELLKHLTETEQANGFANRFLWWLVRRSKSLPRGDGIPHSVGGAFVHELREVVTQARRVDKVSRTLEGEALWASVYPTLSADVPGLLGAVTARAEAQVMRLALLYALLDGKRAIAPVHLRAGLAVWAYAQQSARCIFGARLGDEVADRILRELRTCGGELTETELHELFHRNQSAGRIAQAMDLLRSLELVQPPMLIPGDGRPTTLWRLCEAPPVPPLLGSPA